MIVFSKADGAIIDVLPSPVYQGSNLSGSIYFVAPFSAMNGVTVAFKLPNGEYTKSYIMTGVSELSGVTDKFGKEYNVWEWQDRNAEVTTYAGVCSVQFSVYLPNGQLLTTARTSFEVQQGVLPEPPPTPTDDVYQLIIRYLAVLDARTANVPNLVADIQKVADNAFTFTNNSGVESAPLVFGNGESAPIPENTASKAVIPTDSWQPTYATDQTTVTGYTYIVTAGLHGQMRDGATANDLWVSFDETDGTALLGAFKRYTVDTAGNITVYVNQPVTLTVRVWNGKSLADMQARELVAQETARAEAAEQNLQEQITELQNTGVDEVARAAVAAETQRAEQAEQELQTRITAITNDLPQVLAFSAEDWATVNSYLGALSKEIEIPTGKRIVQVLDENNAPRGTWRGNTVYANYAFAGVAIII